MKETVRKVTTLIGPAQRGRWLVVVVMAMMVSVAEALSTLMVFALLGVLVGDSSELKLPVLGDIRGLVPWEGSELLAGLGAATAIVFVGRSGLILAQHYVQFRMAENTGARLSTRLLDGYLSMPYVFHLERNSSELIRNAFDSVQRFVQEGLIPGVKVFGKMGIVVGVLAVLVVSSPLPTVLAAVSLGPLLWLVMRVVHPRVKRLGRTAQSMAKNTLQTLQQSLHGARDITVLGRKRSFVEAYRRDRRALARARYLRRTAAQVPRVGIETGIVIFIVVFVWVAAAAGGGVDEALPVLGLFGYAAARLMPELQHITQGLNAMKFVGPAVDDISGDLAMFRADAARDRDTQEAQEALPFSDRLSVEGVSYRYPGAEESALMNVDLEIRPGESVGVVGPTGGGKSTFVDVLLGLLEPSEGWVRVDGIDVHKYPRAWQANLGVVPQMVFLIDDTLRANIALGVPPEDINDDALAEAVTMAQLQEFISSLPDGLETLIGERGVRVSGGQRQRVAIARALYRRPRVLVFDEGTSALDNETEEALMEALHRLHGERTLITVAHRLSTVEDCDIVLLMADGQIADSGRLSELAGRHGALQGAGGVPGRVE